MPYTPMPTTPLTLVAFAIGSAIFLLTLLVTRWRARGAERGARRSGRSWIGIAVQAIGVFVAAYGPIRMIDSVRPLETLVVALLMTALIVLFTWSSRTMGRNWSIVARTREDHQLVTSGPFAYIRHPIYVALFLFMLAIAIAYGHAPALLAAIPIYALGTWLRVRIEERLLQDQFGADYDAYAARVKRFVPGLL